MMGFRQKQAKDFATGEGFSTEHDIYFVLSEKYATFVTL